MSDTEDRGKRLSYNADIYLQDGTMSWTRRCACKWIYGSKRM